MTDRVSLLTTRNAMKQRVKDLEARLTKADTMYPHAELDAMPHTELYLDLLDQYEQAFDAMTRADASL